MLKTSQNNISFGANLTPKAQKIIQARSGSISDTTKKALTALQNDTLTKEVSIDITRKKRGLKEFFSFIITPEKTKAKIQPHHPYFKIDPKSSTGLKIMPRKTFFWQNLDEMLKNDILTPGKLKKISKVLKETYSVSQKWAKAKNTDQKIYEYAGITGQKTAELISLTEVKK